MSIRKYVFDEKNTWDGNINTVAYVMGMDITRDINTKVVYTALAGIKPYQILLITIDN